MAQLLPILLKEITCFIGVLYIEIQMFSSLKIGKIKEKGLWFITVWTEQFSRRLSDKITDNTGIEPLKYLLGCVV